MSFTVIAENDESQWHDVTGVSYHFPRRYRKLLLEGTRVVYYKGTLKKARYRVERMSDRAHYFGVARIGRVYPDSQSTKGDFFAEVQDFRPFVRPVDIRVDGELLENVPDSRQANYWRDGVRAVSEEFYNRVVSFTELVSDDATAQDSITNDLHQGAVASLTSAVEGQSSVRVTTVYERNPKLRAAAVAIHGTTCMACGFNFAEF